jgi:uncharacterized membrane protein
MPTARIEAFSDGVFAIIFTLLVLEIHVPQVQDKGNSASLELSLLAMTPKFLSYILSFLLVCIWWVAHNHLFHILKRSDRGLLWLNSLFLLRLAFIPFPTALMGDFPRERAFQLNGSRILGETSKITSVGNTISCPLFKCWKT